MTKDIYSTLLDAAGLLLVGMVVVFVFLTILIGAIHLIEWLSNKVPNAEENVIAPQAAGAQQEAISPQVVAAISSAVHQYRNKK